MTWFKMSRRSAAAALEVLETQMLAEALAGEQDYAQQLAGAVTGLRIGLGRPTATTTANGNG